MKEKSIYLHKATIKYTQQASNTKFASLSPHFLHQMSCSTFNPSNYYLHHIVATFSTTFCVGFQSLIIDFYCATLFLYCFNPIITFF